MSGSGDGDQGNQGDKGGGGDGFKPMTFNSQAEIDEWIAGRVERAKRSATDEIAKKYGNLDELATKASRLDTVVKEQETESERKVREARETAAREAEERVRGESTATIDKARKHVRALAIRTEAIEQGFTEPEDVVLFLAGDDSIAVEEDGDDWKVKGVKPAVKQLAEKRPHWLRSNEERRFRGSPPGGRGNGGSSPTIDPDEMMSRQRGVIGVGTRSI